MNKQRPSYTPDEKVAIIRQHLLDGVAISALCDPQGWHPTLYYRWQKAFFEGGAAAFAKEPDRQVSQLKPRLAAAEEPLARKNEVLAEVMEESVRCKKHGGPLTGRWVKAALRDEVVAFVAGWSERTGLPVKRLLKWLGITASKRWLQPLHRPRGEPRADAGIGH
jgi:transposase-like protein